MADILYFMRWPLLACLLLPPILIYLGLHIIRREIIFVDLALAQVAALGACLAVLLGHHHRWQNYGWSLAFTLIGAALFTLTRTRQRQVPQEALIGIVYVVAAAAGILLLNNSAEGDEELKRMLVGDVLLVSRGEVLRTLGIYLMIGFVHFFWRKPFLQLTFEPAAAEKSGMNLRLWDFLFYALFGIIVTSFVQIGGVLLTFSYLIIPAAAAAFLAESFRGRMIAGWVGSTLSSVLALYLSYRLDWPMGAAIVCVLGAMLALVIAFTAIRR